MARAPVFLRDATGLVREFGALDLLLMMTLVILSLDYSSLQFPWFYGFNPGAYLPLALLIALIPMAFLILSYWGMGVIMPRAGNDYVWVGRVTHPVVGFAWSLLYMVALFCTCYVSVIGLFSLTISTSLATWGILFSVPSLVTLGTWLSSAFGSFVFAVLLTIPFAVLAVVGAKAVKGLVYIGMIVSLVGFLAMWSILITASPTTFGAKWDSFFSQYTTYQGMFAAAAKAGWVPPTFSIAATIVGLPIATLFLFGAPMSSMIAGEIKNVRRALPIALVLSTVITAIQWSITAQLTLGAVGEKWMSAVGYLWDINPSAYYTAIPYPPTQPMILSLLAYPNQALVFIVLFAFIVGSIPASFVFLWLPTRYIFAWAFDRVIPSKMADVGSRLGTPHYAVGATSVLAMLLLYLYSYTGFGAFFAMGTFLQELCYGVIGITVLIFPFVRKDMVDLAPSFMRKRIGGLPLIGLIGALTAISFGSLSYLAGTNPLVSPTTTLGTAIAIGLVIAALVIYYASLVYYRRKGIDIALALKEIPPE
jgi:amino acid transporter